MIYVFKIASTLKSVQSFSSLNTVADWDSMGSVVIETPGRAFQTLGRVFLKSSDDRVKIGSAVCVKISAQPSVSLKRVYENPVCKKHRIVIGV